MNIGTIARTLHSRQLEHKAAVRNKSRSNALSKHQLMPHNDTSAQFATTVGKGGVKFNVERFCYEGQHIEELKNYQSFKILTKALIGANPHVAHKAPFKVFAI